MTNSAGYQKVSKVGEAREGFADGWHDGINRAIPHTGRGIPHLPRDRV